MWKPHCVRSCLILLAACADDPSGSPHAETSTGKAGSDASTLESPLSGMDASALPDADTAASDDDGADVALESTPSTQISDAGPGEWCGEVWCAWPECCPDPFAGVCGLVLGEKACVLRPPDDASSDPRCPRFEVEGLVTLPSCCTEDGQCGIEAEMFGTGCVENAAFEALALQAGTPPELDYPEAMRCGD